MPLVLTPGSSGQNGIIIAFMVPEDSPRLPERGHDGHSPQTHWEDQFRPPLQYPPTKEAHDEKADPNQTRTRFGRPLQAMPSLLRL